jgi:glucose-6-phosphate isomerase
MKEMFVQEEGRFERFSIHFKGLLFDYSKNIITKETIDRLLKLAEAADLKSKINAMFRGQKINTTEKRAVLHTALRYPVKASYSQIFVNGEDIYPDIKRVLDKMEDFVEQVHTKKFRGVTGKKFTDIVNIGIGGSDLGPAMVTEALSYYKVKGIRSHFVSNVDGTDIINTCLHLNPETTLFIIASKTFTTQETMANANAAKNWLLSKLCVNDSKNKGGTTPIIDENLPVKKHFIALSTNIPAVTEFGIDPNNAFEFWDWVGGRYSLWSAIGLSIALSIGMSNFRDLLLGAYTMDEHFRNEDFDKNIPVLMGLLGIWYRNFFNAASQGVIPYDQYLRRFPAFLQQLDMESNGKHTTKDGYDVDFQTGPIVWGEPGTNAQHSFFQLIHQGTQMIPVDFIAFKENVNDDGTQHNILLSNFLAQTEALMKGKTAKEVAAELKAAKEKDAAGILPHKVFAGNKPTNSILIDKLTPHSLGMLIAMYEHKVFVQGALWNLNSFDQWGVELGKQLAKKILPELQSNDKISTHDSSTNGLINYIKNL